MSKSLAQPILRPVHLVAPPEPSHASHPTAPDILAAVRAFDRPEGANTTTMSAYLCPVFLKQALEVIARDAHQTKQHTVAATLDLGLRCLHHFPGVAECLDAQQTLLRESRNAYVRRWLEETVAIDLLTGGLGHTKFTVRVALAQHREVGRLAGALGVKLGQCFTLALTATLIGSPYVPMAEANDAMFATLVDLKHRCVARAHHMEMLRNAPEPTVATVHRTIYDVLRGHLGR
jgi:hypothetical protein